MTYLFQLKMFGSQCFRNLLFRLNHLRLHLLSKAIEYTFECELFHLRFSFVCFSFSFTVLYFIRFDSICVLPAFFSFVLLIYFYLFFVFFGATRFIDWFSMRQTNQKKKLYSCLHALNVKWCFPFNNEHNEEKGEEKRKEKRREENNKWIPKITFHRNTYLTDFMNS